MKNIVMLKQCNVGGKSRQVGAIVDATAGEAHYLTGCNSARYADDLGGSESSVLTTRSMKNKPGKKSGDAGK